MRRAEVLQGMRMLKVRSVLDRWKNSELSQVEAAERLGGGARTFRRWCGRYREGGEAGLQDRRVGQQAANRVPQAEAARVEALYRERFAGFTAKCVHEPQGTLADAREPRGCSRIPRQSPPPSSTRAR